MSESERVPSTEMYATAIEMTKKKNDFLSELFFFEVACREAGFKEQGDAASEAYSKVCQLNLTRLVESF